MKKSCIVGITGILGSGKTTVSNIIKDMGFKVISCDEIVQKLLNKKFIIKRIEKIFGSDVLIGENLNRKKIRKIIFDDAEKKEKLEKLIHPFVFDKIKKEIFDTKKKGGIIFIEIPLLFETKSEFLFDKIIVVSSRLKEIKERLKNKYLKEEIEKIWKSQISLTHKKKEADYIVDNSGSILKTQKCVKRIIQNIKKEIN
ncbi:MAG: dephospho-CoA kinase [Candidatus Omnitrophica bacterium]|nr:dephospho-CoA kinase [Candidatus Omnitrophota bacterium]